MLSLTNFYLVAHVENMKSMSIIHKELNIYLCSRGGVGSLTVLWGLQAGSHEPRTTQYGSACTCL